MLPVEDLRTSSDPQLQLLRDRASQVHLLRSAEQATVSRTSLLYAAATISPLVLAVFEINGLNVGAWERSIGFDRRPALGAPEPAGDFEVHADTANTLGQHAGRWPERRLDVLGVVTAIFLEIDGNARRHVTSAGLNVDTAAKQLMELTDAAPDGLVDYARLGYLYSQRTLMIFNGALAINRDFNVRYRALTASQVAIAAISISDDHPATAPSFLHNYVRDHARAGLTELIARWMSWYDKESSATYDRWTQTLTAIVLRAQHLSQQSRNRPEIAARHLIGALVASDRWAANSGVARFCVEAGIDQRKLARAYFEYLSTSPVDDTQPRRDDLAVWRSFLGFSAESVVPRFNAEDLAGDDLLNVTDNVDAFASLIASNRIDPPLSIGLFGDWGSGKSFFMTKMREAIAERAQRATGRSDSVFHQRIVQIDFNAWHYVEANLWASMVEHLFRNLKLTYEKPGDQTVTARREELLKQLDTLMADKVAAEQNVLKAELERDRAAQELEATKKAVDSSAAAARTLRAKDVWEMIEVAPEERKQLQQQLDQLGAAKVLASATDIRKTFEELGSVRTRTSLLTNWIVRQPKSLLLLLVLLLLAPFVAVLLAAAMARIAPNVYESVGKAVAQVATYVGVITAWLAKRLSSGKKLLDAVDSARAKIDDRIQNAETKIQTDIRTADTALEKAAAAVTTAQAAVVTSEQAVLDAKNELLKLTNGYRLNRFIDERAASDDYRKLLGVLATVRSDFAMLSELMHPKIGACNLNDDLRIDRIILYIDDLDRCEPDRVIEVLQAVHLLLAFKLFVVVVGVDARWVSESLRQKHRALRGRSDRPYDSEDDLVGYAVEPHDYLEKIFQVPFWLDPLKPKTAGTYIANLLAPDLPEQATRLRQGAASGGSARGVQADSGQQQVPEVLHTMSDDEEDESDPKQLTIEKKERDYMMREELACLVSRSPRTAKRFVNTYRFFRASIERESLARYLDDECPAEYRCALVMLAIVVGAPDVSLELFEQMRRANSNTRLEVFVKTVKIDDEHAAEWKMIIDSLSDLGKTEVASVSHVLPFIGRVSRYSFRPPHKLQKKKPAAKPEYLISIRNDERNRQPTV